MAKQTHLFKCSCEGATEMNFEDFKKHLAEIHNLKTEEDFKGSRQMVMHLDGSKFFSSTYKWTLNSGLTFTEFYESSRSKKDIWY